MFTVNIVASCSPVEWRRRHTPPLIQNFGAAIFRRFFPPRLFLCDSRCKWTPIPPCNRKTGLWFYLKIWAGVELNVVCWCCFWGGFFLSTAGIVWPPVGSLLSPPPQSVRGPATMAVGSLARRRCAQQLWMFFKSIHFFSFSFVDILKWSNNKTIVSIWRSWCMIQNLFH